MSFSYDISVRVNRTLSTVSSTLYSLEFCPAGSTLTPPALQVAVAAAGTAVAKGVQARCYTLSTSADTVVVPSSPFGTNATQSYVFMRENSSNAGALVNILDSQPNVIFSLKNGQAAFFPRPVAGDYYAQVTSTASTGTLQILVIGE